VPRALRHTDVTAALIARLSSGRVEATVRTLAAFENRFFTSDGGVQAVEWLRGQYAAIGHGVRSVPFEHTALWRQPSLVSSVGSGARTVVLGAHVDSINRQNWTVNERTGRAPGANDDGTGIAVGLDVMRAFAELAAGGEHSELTQRATLVTHAYAAEEVGLLGSRRVARAARAANQRIDGMLQLDQCGWVRTPSSPRLGVYTDNTNAELTRLVEMCIDKFGGVPWVHSVQTGRANTDSTSFHNEGYRAAYVAEGPIDDIVYGNDKHTSHDVFDASSYGGGISMSHVMAHARVAACFAVEMALDGARE